MSWVRGWVGGWGGESKRSIPPSLYSSVLAHLVGKGGDDWSGGRRDERDGGCGRGGFEDLDALHNPNNFDATVAVALLLLALALALFK